LVNDQAATAPKVSVTVWLPSATKSPVTRKRQLLVSSSKMGASSSTSSMLPGPL
jgi:hypothetical protein